MIELKIALFILLLPFLGAGQNKGVHFEEGVSWLEVKEKAKQENKYLFVDCYTTWCAPCKKMSAEVFPQEKVGDFFNRNFINIKVQFDQTKNDSEEVKNWYADAVAINKEFKITAYPTFLIFSPQGELVHRIVGGGNADDFIARTKEALNRQTQYYTILKDNGSSMADPQKLKQLALAANIANDEENAAKYADAYIATQKDVFTRNNMEFISRFVKKSKSRPFELVLNNVEKVDAALGIGKANEILGAVIIRENIDNVSGNSNVDIDSLVAVTQAKYPTVNLSKRTDMVKILFFLVNKRWDRFQPAIVNYMTSYSSELTPGALNYFARTVFENCKDSGCVAAAADWSKRSVEKTLSKEPIYLYTYAGLLFKIGRTKEAISMQQKAVNLEVIRTCPRF